MNTREIGRAGESAVCDYMTAAGYTVLCRNYIYDHCEIDIIAERDNLLVFTEVKMRKEAEYRRDYGRPSAAVTKDKREHLRRAAKQYLKEHPTDRFPRMDVCEVWFREEDDGTVSFRFQYIERAFGAEEARKTPYLSEV